MSDLRLEYCQFTPSKPVNGFIGFMSFKIGRDYSWYKLGVHLLKKRKNETLVRLVYPELQAPPTKIMQEEIDCEATKYLMEYYPQSFIGNLK